MSGTFCPTFLYEFTDTFTDTSVTYQEIGRESAAGRAAVAATQLAHWAKINAANLNPLPNL
jgi:hypothetical protein